MLKDIIRALKIVRYNSRLIDKLLNVNAEVFNLIRKSRIIIKILTFVLNFNDYIFITFFINSTNSNTIESFLTKKKAKNKQISIKLRIKGVIITFGELFAIS